MQIVSDPNEVDSEKPQGQAIPEAVRKAYARQLAELRNIDAEPEEEEELAFVPEQKADAQPEQPQEEKRYNLRKGKEKSTEAIEQFLEQRREPASKRKRKARRKTVALGTRPEGAEKSAVRLTLDDDHPEIPFTNVVTIVGHRNENAEDIFDVELWAIFNDNTVGWVKLRDFFYDPEGGNQYGILDVALTYLKAHKKELRKVWKAL